MAKATNITVGRQNGQTKVRKIQVRDKKIAISLFLDKATGLRLAKEIEKKWGKKNKK